MYVRWAWFHLGCIFWYIHKSLFEIRQGDSFFTLTYFILCWRGVRANNFSKIQCVPWGSTVMNNCILMFLKLKTRRFDARKLWQPSVKNIPSNTWPASGSSERYWWDKKSYTRADDLHGLIGVTDYWIGFYLWDFCENHSSYAWISIEKHVGLLRWYYVFI